MKKSLIAGAGATAFAFAALPFAGVFAATTTSFQDSLTVTVQGSCTLEGAAPGAYTENDRSFSKDIPSGTVNWLNATSDSEGVTGQTMTVYCNTPTGNWSVGVSATDLIGDNSSSVIAPGTTYSGNTSAWAIKSNAANIGETNIENPYASYAAYASGTFLKAPASTANGRTKATFNPSYKVYISPNQAADTYRNTVTYTVTYPATS